MPNDTPADTLIATTKASLDATSNALLRNALLRGDTDRPPAISAFSALDSSQIIERTNKNPDL
ncbi:MAG TPA: hypothetical protein O0X23_01170 [Methanocorpusculum sp.]|nr:hypothetical protein [Methanocorpusculum sp.]